MHPDNQYWFAFSFEGATYTFTRLCQGYCESPTIYNAALHQSLASLQLPENAVLLMYVDDLLIAAPNREICKQATLALLHHIAEQGHKASKAKLQFCKETVQFLGHKISHSTHSLTTDCVMAITKIPKPVTKKQLLSFLGMCLYCRTFIPSYSEIEGPLRDLISTKGSSSSKLSWTADAEAAFVRMKQSLQTMPALGIPDPSKPFVQTVDCRDKYMTSVLTQMHGDRQRPVAYFSCKLDPVAAGLPLCARAVAAAEKALIASRDIVGYSELTLLVPHAVSCILQNQKVAHLSTQRWLRYHTALLCMPNITASRVKRTESLMTANKC